MPNFVKKHQHEEEDNRFRSDLSKLGFTIDLDYLSEFTRNRNNYSDHFHIKPAIADTLVYMINQNYPAYNNE